LQLQNHPNIFVGGDITNISEEKTAFNADRHAKHIYHNLIKKMKNQQLKPYKSMPPLLIISLGKRDGILTFKHLIIPHVFAAIFKFIIKRITLISRH